MSKCYKNFLTALIFLMPLCIHSQANACTDFRLTANDGSIVIARSMEFAIDLKSNLRSSPRGRSFKSTLPNSKAGLAWTAKYGYVYLDGLNVDMAVDGMNEKGLAFEALYLPNIAEYQKIMPNKENQALPYLYIGDWAMSNFATVEEVRAALVKIQVVDAKIPDIGNMGNTILPLHFSFHDASGNSIVVEYVAGKLNIHDNKVGVMTNDPTYDWHITNLNNYIHLEPTNPKPIVIKDMTFIATGQGSGMLGLPGDISPPSRFVKVSVLKAVVQPAANGPSAVNLAEHIINNVDIPFGLAREPANGNYTSEYTQWTVFKDLKSMKFYYKTYLDTSLRAVEMDQINFAANAPMLKMPIETQTEYVNNLTDAFKHSASS